MKRRILIAMLVSLALWPIVQIALVRRYGVDPWELYGWGMYTRPHLDADVRAFALPDGRSLVLAREELDAIRAFELAWRHLGRLASPSAAAARILGRRPDLEGVRLVGTKLELDPATDRIVAREDRWEIFRR